MRTETKTIKNTVVLLQLITYLKELLLEKQPSKRFVSADDIAKLANYLCKKESSNITGASWTIDGGWSSQ